MNDINFNISRGSRGQYWSKHICDLVMFLGPVVHRATNLNLTYYFDFMVHYTFLHSTALLPFFLLYQYCVVKKVY